jgi:hypothetical protein
MSLEIIENGLKDAYTYLVVPKVVLDTPIELAKMAKEDGTYYTLNELSQALGKMFVLTNVIDDRFVKFRWSIPLNGEEALIVEYLKSQGLVDMRDNGVDGELNYTVDEIDFSKLNGNEFGLFAMQEIKLVPVPQVADEEAI